MFNTQRFFKERFSSHVKETSRYLRYIFNGHIAIAMMFFVSALAYYYQQWLAQIPTNFPTASIVGIVLGFITSYSPVRTLLKEPDLVFLLPAENRMAPYFRSTLIYSFLIQLYLIFLVAAALGPLYFTSFPERSGKDYLLMLVVLLVLKVWNLLANWWMLRIRDPRSRLVDHIGRFILSALIFVFYVSSEIVLAGITTILLFVNVLYAYILAQKHNAIAWDLLVEKDRSRMRTFYRIANMFTDVPHMKNQVKKRHWLVALITKNIPFQQDRTYEYLYRITVIRSGDYLGMYTRLIIIGGLAIYFVPSLWVKVAFSILFLYLTGFQLMTLWQHHRTVAWLDLYPIHIKSRQAALIKWLFQLMLVQTFLFGLLFLLMKLFTGLVIVWLAGALFSYLFIHGYVKKSLI
ncbi:ABC transporter permease [Aquibacillus sp. 3ASR75-11]|uniref:ABC transporter permease n=1 Tax=Terrihalobacillus insolitus TaxID=2950438 RepID=A0A9X4AMM9_9BACI|nr:ABC transporter permease [Terrihalobacillus insolitus]MDC3413756.1 ABC transporter permease [Terrihalobacillus insolitus]MDC3425617.1 ABC transporter permease [Terrihalobacillus insolitus]